MNTGYYQKVCCFTGHRDISSTKLAYVERELTREICEAMQDGYMHFFSGFAQGTDLLFASIVVELMSKYPQVTLEAAIPYRDRMNTPDPLFHRLIGKCKVVGIHSERYSPACFVNRNRFMVSESQRVIAVYDGRNRGGTFSTLRCAQTQQLEIRIIRI